VRLVVWGSVQCWEEERGAGVWLWEGNRGLWLNRVVDKAVNRMGLGHSVFWPRR